MGKDCLARVDSASLEEGRCFLGRRTSKPRKDQTRDLVSRSKAWGPNVIGAVAAVAGLYPSFQAAWNLLSSAQILAAN